MHAPSACFHGRCEGVQNSPTDFARDYAAFDAAHETWLPADRRPARTTVGVTALAVAALVETDLVARRPEPG